MKKHLRRHLSLMLALRYLNPLRTMFSIITLICLAGVALGVTVLIVVLSVMSGLQKQMESSVLAFTPHYLVSYYNDGARTTISGWQELVERARKVPGVTSAYAQLENQSFVQSDKSRQTCTFRAIDTENEEQMNALRPLIKQGTFDLDLGEKTVISAITAKGLGVGIGDTIRITPVGDTDQVIETYTQIGNEKPLATQEDTDLLPALGSLWSQAENPSGIIGNFRNHLAETALHYSGLVLNGMRGSASAFLPPTVADYAETRYSALLRHTPAQWLAVPKTAVQETYRKLRAAFDGENDSAPALRPVELNELDALNEIIRSGIEGKQKNSGIVYFERSLRTAWEQHLANLRDNSVEKENIASIKNIRSLIMPKDLTVIGIYQPTENMPGPALFIPLPIGQELLGFQNDDVQGIAIRTEDPYNLDQLAAPILQSLPPLPAGSAWELSPWTESFREWFQLIANERTMMSFVLSFIALISAFCIMAVMFTVSMQRRREIAVLQALGATPSKIMRVFLWQGVIIGISGAILGIILALLVLHYRIEIQGFLAGMGLDPFPMQAHGIQIPCSIDPVEIAKQGIYAFIMVTVASVVPALVVSRQDPSKALRAS